MEGFSPGAFSVKMTPLATRSARSFHAHRQAGNAALRPRFVHHHVQVRQHLRHRHRVQIPLRVVTLFHQLLQVTPRNLHRYLVGDHLPGALLLLHPCRARQRNGHAAPIHAEDYVHRVGVPGGNGHNVRLPHALQLFPGPAVGHAEILIHASRVPAAPAPGTAELQPA